MINYCIILPPILASGSTEYQGCNSYSEYNYLQGGIVSWIKRRHLTIALNLGKNFFYNGCVIDFGCADGIFLPSLSVFFKSVVAIDNNEIFCVQSQRLVDVLKLHNVSVVNNCNLSINQLKERIPDNNYDIIYLLEIIEHIGNDYSTMYEDKSKFIKDIFSLIDDNGICIISVPKMVGLTYLIQYVGLKVFNLYVEKLSLKNLIKAALLSDTHDLEKNWRPLYGHIGFNHIMFEKYLKDDFIIEKKVNDLFQVVYSIKKIKVV
jgi:2-polyprenyl-3-methyl-5-hydroxy-6-metoxy-1,4-benzoquinol methylase